MRLKSILLTFISLIFSLISSQHLYGQEQSKGLDQRINEAFTPFSQAIENIVLFTVPIGNTEVPFIVILLSLGGLFFTIYFGFPNILKFRTAINIVRGKYNHVLGDIESDSEDEKNQQIAKTDNQHGEVSHFQALATALSGTVGLGNIAGVTIAITLGGPGATFWMIVSGLLGMTLKFVECTLGVKYRDIGSDGTVYGGPMYYLSKGLKSKGYDSLGRVLAIIFSVLCIGGALGIGNAAQSNQATAQIISTFGIEGSFSRTVIGILIALVVGLTLIGGIKRIARVTEKLVPFMALVYILACLVILMINFDKIGATITQIITEAFQPQAGLGGIIGVLIIGFRRAAFSNEAGAGSSPIAHSAVRTKYPASEGIVALLEPFIDTVVICTLTALVITIFNIDGVFAYGQSEVIINGEVLKGATLTSYAFESTISWFPYVLTVAIILFAISTLISWSYYGQQAWAYIFGKKYILIYQIIFLIFTVIGASSDMESVWGFADAMILAMIFPNMIGLLFLFKEVGEQVKTFEKVIKNKPANVNQ